MRSPLSSLVVHGRCVTLTTTGIFVDELMIQVYIIKESLFQLALYVSDRNEEGAAQIMPRGRHRLAFQFQLPESALPCSFESKIGQIRYYLRVTIDIPYASPPQGIKYFTIVGPHIDCMEDRFLVVYL